MKRVFIIAEIGVNHNGSLDLAYKLVDAAAETGVDAVKFQTSKAENVISLYATKAEYQKDATGKKESQLEMVKKLKLEYSAHLNLIDHCAKKKIKFLSSPFDLQAIEDLNDWGLGILKIPSGEITHLPYLRKIGRLNKNIILSTGMADLSEVKTAMNILTKSGTRKENITILHCNSEYPTPFEDVNLNAMLTIRDELGVKVGYSDHSLGIEVSIAAVALGAEIIEKHLTLDKNMEGPDHKASLEPDELKSMVKSIRNIEKSMGNGIKNPSSSEFKNRAIVRKSIVALRTIKKGECFSEENITAKRPGTGISAMRWDEVLGLKAKRDFSMDEMIKL